MRVFEWSMRFFSLLLLLLLRLTAFLVPAGVLVRRCWLIGEHRGVPHQDNGYAFFRYCIEQGHEHVYFVANRDEIERDPFLKASPFAISYGSISHLWRFAYASVLLYTHTYHDILHPHLFWLAAPRRKLVFLQHGVTAFKKFHPWYQQHCNAMDRVLAVSAYEANILRESVGIDADRICVTGFPRFDRLFSAKAAPARTRILYFPTWRDWISDENFESSLFLSRVMSLIGSRSLHELLGEQNAEIVVCLHARMRNYVSQLMSVHDRVRVVGHGDEHVHDLLLSSAMLVTDYSSVSWDFLYLGRPVVFYAFDDDDYLRERGSYVPLDPPPFGERVTSEAELLNLLGRTLKKGCRLRAEDGHAREVSFAFRDADNCRRVFLAIKDLQHG